ncbi:hypothetical protein [Microbacterium sp. NPDC087665]|uniref:hypothetical protein n=1 Tax=Microbacterium sp. NPDC087665 TaxID=3364194 RepID=UPI0037F3227A
MRLIYRGVAAGLVTGALAIGLIGCNLNWEVQGPYALTIRDGDLLLALCEPLEIDSIRVSEVLRESDATSSRLVWEANGPVSTKDEQILVIGGRNDGLMNVVVEPSSRLSDIRYLRVRLNDGQQAALAASIYIPDGGLVEGQWISPRGDRQDQPCGSEVAP